MRLEADDGRPETSPPLRRGVQTADRAVVRERQAIPEDPPSWPDILRTIELGYSNARLEASDNRIKVTIRMAYGFHHVDNLIAPQERSNIPIEHCDTAMSLLKELSVAFNAFL